MAARMPVFSTATNRGAQCNSSATPTQFLLPGKEFSLENPGLLANAWTAKWVFSGRIEILSSLIFS
jgi:hypothetical protein